MAMPARILPPMTLALACLAAWELGVHLTQVSPLVLPAPGTIARAMWNHAPELAAHAGATLGVTLTGFPLSIAFALVCSIWLHLHAASRQAVLPLMVISQTIPLVALAPLMIMWFGFGLLPKVLLVILVTFFPILLSLLAGYRTAPVAHADLLASMGAGRWTILTRATLPAARPQFLAGLRISATYAVVATIFAEYAGARQGIGIFILTAKNNFRADLVLAAVLVSATMTLALLGLIAVIDRLTGRRYRHA